MSVPADARRVVTHAREAFSSWSRVPLKERTRVLGGIRHALLEESDSLVSLIARETGKPAAEAWGAEILPVLEACSTLRAEAARWLAGRPVSVPWLSRSQGVREGRVTYEPLGVIGIIGTWNYPLMIDALKVVSAIVCGNTVVWKPSEYSTASAQVFHLILHRAGLPEGVCGLVIGGRSMGESLVEAGCDKFLFTGSVSTGREIMSKLAESGTPAVMELSGLDACLVCSDAPLPLAAEGIAWGAFSNAGQTCVAPRRIYVDHSIHPEFLKHCLEVTRALRVGSGPEGTFDMGPLRDERSLIHLEELIEDAQRKGARVETGGSRRRDLPGCFFEPTVLTRVHDGMRIMTEDFFGPVVAVQEVSGEEEMVKFANQPAYGLAASIWSRDLSRAQGLAGRLECGVVWINGNLTSVSETQVPFGGVKASGFGRVNGPEGLKELVNIKYVETRSARVKPRRYFPYTAQGAEIIKGLAWIRHGQGLRGRLRGARMMWKAVRRK